MWINSFKYFITGLFRFPLLEGILVSPLLQHSKYNRWIIRKIAPRLFQYNSLDRRISVRRGIKYELQMNQHLDYSVYYDLTNDATRLKLYSLIKPGDIVLDVGTNIGEVLLNCAQIVGGSGKVFGFEPHPVTYDKLMRNINLNRFNNLEVFPVGLSEKHQKYEMYEVIPGNMGANRVLQQAPENASRSLTIDTLPLDEWIEENKIARVDFIKIDVEGFEWAVLQGAKETLQKFRPVLFIELIDEHLRNHQVTASDLVGFLLNSGYEVFRAEDDLKVEASFPLNNCLMDVYCIPPRENNVLTADAMQ
jgi:FkbM family methyltransferase